MNDIKSLFPTEETDLYYDPSHNLNENNKRKRVNSTGYLYTTYLNFRDRAVNLKLLDSKKNITSRGENRVNVKVSIVLIFKNFGIYGT